MTYLTKEDFDRVKDIEPLIETTVLLSEVVDGKVKIIILSTENKKII